MQPILVMPMSDPAGTMFPHLATLVPLLKSIFAQAVVSVTAPTQHNQSDYVAWLEADDLFKVLHFNTDPPVGEAFAALYLHAATICNPEQVLHLCYIDRLAFGLQSQYRDTMIADIQNVMHTPLIFQRSSAAWDTHPANYHDIEGMVTRVGELLFGQSLDFGWCHLVATAGQLQTALEEVSSPDWRMVAELVLALKDTVQTQDVDWLAWEDPFVTNSDPQQLKVERENSRQETLKRLTYAIPMMQLLYDSVQD